MSWVVVSGRIITFIILSVLLGWFYGQPLIALVIGLSGLVVFWLYQLRKVQKWLQDPSEAPPDAYGIWGDLLAKIYLNQRRHTQTQERLQSTVEYLQNSFASMRDGVVMVDEQGAITWMNRAVEPLLGLHYPEDTGQPLTNLVRVPELKAYFLDGDYEKPLQYTTGGENRIHLRVEVTYFGESERLLFVRDVSEAVLMEQIRRDFVANVSHELRTPLTVISGYLGTLIGQAADFPDRYKKPLQQMNQQAERMESLLKDLLWLSRIEAEERQDKRELVDVGGLLQELREELATAHPERELGLDLLTDRKIYGDYRELYSAVSNLANNALKYSPPETPVEIVWESTGDHCRLSVKDEGRGIDSTHIPRLTERFYRVDDSRSSATGGTGLGLAIVKHVAAAHNARLEIDSTPGEGSTFSLAFPLRE